jgi:phage-related holin
MIVNTTAITCNETLSIIENNGQIGLPIPDSISKALEVLKGKKK